MCKATPCKEVPGLATVTGETFLFSDPENILKKLRTIKIRGCGCDNASGVIRVKVLILEARRRLGFVWMLFGFLWCSVGMEGGSALRVCLSLVPSGSLHFL